MTSVIENIKPKRGRRSKKDIAAAAALAEANNNLLNGGENIIIESLNPNTSLQNVSNIELQICTDYTGDKNNDSGNVGMDSDIDKNITDENIIVKPPPKKRGRKPKGGKIILQTLPIASQKETKPNIILHLKCALKDLKSDGEHNSNFTIPNIESFNFSCSKSELLYEVINNQNVINNNNNNDIISEQTPSTSANTFGSIQESLNMKTNVKTKVNNMIPLSESLNPSYDYNEKIREQQTYSSTIVSNCGLGSNCGLSSNSISCSVNRHNDVHDYDENGESNEIWKKLKTLEHNLHINNVSDKKSACFWCSHDFDNPPIYIPKHFIKDSYQVYGCFCTPECAVAHLMQDNIDTSTKFERYHLLNHIYSKIYNYKKNIKPAPNPYYMLERFYGNLTIQEYRSLLKSERLFLIVDKPLTRILPEFHEDNDEFIINNKIIPSNNYQVKKKLQKKTQSKHNIMNEQFGLNTL